MNDKKNIDRLFREKFKNFEAAPQDSLWDKVNLTLHPEDNTKKPIPFWWKRAGIAAGLIVLVTAGIYFMGNSEIDSTNHPLVEEMKIDKDDNLKLEPLKDVDDNTITESKIEKGFTLNEIESDKKRNKENSLIGNGNPNLDKTRNNSNIDTGNPNLISSSQKAKTSINKNNIAENQVLESVLNPDNFIENPKKEVNSNRNSLTDINKATDPEMSISKNIDNKSKNKGENIMPHINGAQITDYPTDVSTVTNENPKNKDASIKEEITAIHEESNENEKEDIEKMNRWNISPNVSPVYFNSLGKGSSIDTQFNENSKTGNVNFSYGLNGSYALSEKFKIRAGINKVDLGYRTNEVIVYRNTNATVNGNERLRYVKFKDTEQNTSFISASNLNYAVIPDVIANNIKGSIDQEIGFIEVPLEIEYSLINKRVGINVIGGFSTFFLNKNEVYSTLQGDRTLIGEATNLNDMSYSANIGLGFNLQFSKSVDLSLEPTFKYQFETFNDSSGNFQPYIVGVYSGLRFKF